MFGLGAAAPRPSKACRLFEGLLIDSVSMSKCLAFCIWMEFLFRGSTVDHGTPLGSWVHVPHGGVRGFYQKSTCLTQLTLGLCVVQIWSRNALKFRGDETRVLHRAD